ncbi:hypothetical protein WA026_008876 [Henosepilachna vigintioctopunctata]|uniref:Uncharacterized protein n=1 Tax=Henosepilachna vigintioctopunctata TaxID=420089 RepID=A0AAW1V316_9CUCU
MQIQIIKLNKGVDRVEYRFWSERREMGYAAIQTAFIMQNLCQSLPLSLTVGYDISQQIAGCNELLSRLGTSCVVWWQDRLSLLSPAWEPVHLSFAPDNIKLSKCHLGALLSPFYAALRPFGSLNSVLYCSDNKS